MSTAVVVGLDQSTRYEALMRISNSIRACKESEDLFEILVHELGKVIPFDAIAQFESATNIPLALRAGVPERAAAPA